MPRILLLLVLVLGAVPLWAQQSLNHGDQLTPSAAPTVVPDQPPGSATVVPGMGEPKPGEQPPGTPAGNPNLPALPPMVPQLTGFSISPGTIREGLTDKNVIKTTVILSAPATKDLHYHVVSSNPGMMFCADIVVLKGQTEQNGSIKIDWKQVHRNTEVEAKVSDAEHPETLLHARVYLRKKLE